MYCYVLNMEKFSFLFLCITFSSTSISPHRNYEGHCRATKFCSKKFQTFWREFNGFIFVAGNIFRQPVFYGIVGNHAGDLLRVSWRTENLRDDEDKISFL